MKVKKYPSYMYHQEYNEPRRVDNLGELQNLQAIGWVNHRIWKEFPKMVNGIIIKNKAEEKLLLDAAAKQPKVEVKKTILTPDGTPLHTHKPTAATKGQVQVPANAPVGDTDGADSADPVEVMAYEITNGEGSVIPDLQLSTWAEAQAVQKELNKNAPGHKARKITVE